MPPKVNFDVSDVSTTSYRNSNSSIINDVVNPDESGRMFKSNLTIKRSRGLEISQEKVSKLESNASLRKKSLEANSFLSIKSTGEPDSTREKAENVLGIAIVDQNNGEISAENSDSSSAENSTDSGMKEYYEKYNIRVDEDSSETSELSSEEWGSEDYNDVDTDTSSSEEYDEVSAEASDTFLCQRYDKIAQLIEKQDVFPNSKREFVKAIDWLLLDKEQKAKNMEARMTKKFIEKESKKLYDSKEYIEYVSAKREFKRENQLLCKLIADKTQDKKENKKALLLEGPIRAYYEHWNRVFQFDGNDPPALDTNAKQDIISLIDQAEYKILAFIGKCRSCYSESEKEPTGLDHSCNKLILDYIDSSFDKFSKSLKGKRRREVRNYKLRTRPRYEGHGPVKTSGQLMKTFRLRQFHENNWWSKYLESLHSWEQQHTFLQALQLRSYVTQRKYWRKYRKGKYKPKYKRPERKKGGTNRPRSPWKI